MVLHGLQQRVNGLLAEVILRLAVEGVGLVHEQHAAHGLLDDLLGLQGCLPHIPGHQTAAVHLHQLPLGQNAQAAVDAGHHPGHHGLARAGVAGEHHVQRHIRGGQVVLPAQLVDLHHVDEVVDLLLHRAQPDIAVQLRHQVLHLLRRRQLLLGGLSVAGLGRGGGGRVLLFLALAGCGRGGGGHRLFSHVFKGRAPKVAVHPLHAVFRHGADHVQLLQNDLILLVHTKTTLSSKSDMRRGPQQQRRHEPGQRPGKQGHRQQKRQVAQHHGAA